MYPIFATFIVLLIFCLGTGTYVRNMAWESPEALWTDAVRKAPSSGRALAYLAMVQSELPGGTQIALRLYEAALAGTKTNKQLEPEIFNNMAALYYDAGDFNQAARFWEKALEKNPDYADARFRLSLASLKAGRRDEALGQLQRLIAKYPGHIPSRNLRGMVYFDNNDFESALRDFKLVMKPGPEFAAGLINAGAVFVVTGHYDKADAFLGIRARRLGVHGAGLFVEIEIRRDARGHVAGFKLFRTAAVVGEHERGAGMAGNDPPQFDF